MSEKKCFAVAMFGVSEREQRVLKTTLLVSRGRVRSYVFADELSTQPPDILIVDGDSETARKQWLARHAYRMTPVVFLGQGDGRAVNSVVVTRPYAPSRLLEVFDEITRKMLKFAPELTIGAEVLIEDVSMHSVFPHGRAPSRPSRYALVVDDSLTVRKQLEVLLRNLGIGVDLAESGEQALHYLGQNQYDIVFLDVVLPGVDGYHLCKTIKKDKRIRATPTVMLTSKSSPFDRVRGSLAGCDAYLTKPVDAETFHAVLAAHLKEGNEILRAAGRIRPAGATS